MADGTKRERPAVDVTVATHRRSGTHVMLSYLEGQFGLNVAKEHRFRGATVPSVPTVYVVRHPVDVLWSTYRWFVNGQSSNTVIRSALHGTSFDAFLRGEAGPIVGYRSMTQPPRDSFLNDRGMLYDPIRFWADHVESYADDGHSVIVRYESLVAEPAVEMARVAGHLGVEMPDAFRPIDRDELVGHAPSSSAAPAAIDAWTDETLRLLADRAGHAMTRFGYAVPRTRSTTLPRVRQQLRYVSRDDNSGYAVAGRRCVGAMVAAGLDVVWEPQPKEWGERSRPLPATPASLAELYRPDTRCDVTVMHTMPEWWAGLRRAFGRGHFTGHTVWELDQYPDDWHRTAFAADELWVPTEWNRTTFRAGGLRQPVHVVPHVVTTDPVHEPPIDIPEDVTVFVTVASWHPRKRPDWTVEAFARAFTRDDPVLLIVKTEAWTDSWPADNDLQRMTWWQLMQVLRRHPNAPHVMLVNDAFTDAEVNGLVQRADCYVSLACSEGWGLGMFDAATLGTPVITTGFGGHLTYLGHEHPGLVPYRMVPVGDVENSPHFQPGMQWARPNLDAAAEMMKAIVDGTSSLPAGAPELAERLRATYSPAVVGARTLTLLEQYL